MDFSPKTFLKTEISSPVPSERPTASLLTPSSEIKRSPSYGYNMSSSGSSSSLSQSTDVFKQAQINEELDKWLNPFLMCTAAAKGDLDKLRHVIESKQLNPSEGDYDGRTPLHLASEEGHIEIVKYLITKGASLNVEDRWGTTPLKGAISCNRNDVAAFLKEHGAVLHVTNRHKAMSNEKLVKSEERTAELRMFFKDLDIESPSPDVITMKSILAFLKSQGLLRKKSKLLDEQLKALEIASGASVPANPKTLAKNVSGTALQVGKIVSSPMIERERSTLITFQAFLDLMNGEPCLLQRAFNSDLKVRNWVQFCTDVEAIFESCRDIDLNGGHNADYIPELAEVQEDLWGIAVVSVDGQILQLGDFSADFSIQSCGKPLQYSICAEDIGIEQIHKYVGQEPSGVAFNSFTLNSERKPHNPLINSGAIMVSSLFKRELVVSKRFKYLTQYVSDLAGGEKIGFNQSVYLSEKGVAHRNFALAHFMKAEGGFPPDVDILAAVDFYFQMCSLQVNCMTMASVAACYANNGQNPLSNQKVLSSANVKHTLQLMYSCGLYDFSGEWACTIGLPAKSGVSGCIFAVIPDIAGICIYSPPLDSHGNSVRAVEFFKRFVAKFNWSLFDVLFDKF